MLEESSEDDCGWVKHKSRAGCRNEDKNGSVSEDTSKLLKLHLYVYNVFYSIDLI